MRHALAGLGVCALALALTGCAADDKAPQGEQGSPSASASPAAGAGSTTPASPGPPRASRPPAPPKQPTDQVGTGVVTGTVMAASPAMCLTLVTDDGEQYALFNPHKVAISKAERIRVTIGPPPKKPACTGATGHQGTATSISKVQ